MHGYHLSISTSPSPSTSTFPPPALQTSILRLKFPTLCCNGFNLRSLPIPPQSSPHLSTKCRHHSLSRSLCNLGLFFFSSFAEASRSFIIPVPPFCVSSPPSRSSSSESEALRSFKGSFSGLCRLRFEGSSCTLMIAPVVGSRVTFAVEAPRVFGALEEGMARAGFWGLLVVGWEEG